MGLSKRWTDMLWATVKMQAQIYRWIQYRAPLDSQRRWLRADVLGNGQLRLFNPATELTLNVGKAHLERITLPRPG